MKVIIICTFCCDNLSKSNSMALEKPGKLGIFFSLFVATLFDTCDWLSIQPLKAIQQFLKVHFCGSSPSFVKICRLNQNKIYCLFCCHILLPWVWSVLTSHIYLLMYIVYGIFIYIGINCYFFKLSFCSRAFIDTCVQSINSTLGVQLVDIRSSHFCLAILFLIGLILRHESLLRDVRKGRMWCEAQEEGNEQMLSDISRLQPTVYVICCYAVTYKCYRW